MAALGYRGLPWPNPPRATCRPARKAPPPDWASPPSGSPPDCLPACLQDVSIVSKSISSFSNVALYAVADGHNGTQAAKAVAATLPGELSRQIGGGLQAPTHPHPEAVRAALARAFVSVDDLVCTKFLQSGEGGGEAAAGQGWAGSRGAPRAVPAPTGRGHLVTPPAGRLVPTPAAAPLRPSIPTPPPPRAFHLPGALPPPALPSPAGCTLTAAVVSGGDVLTVANVGDSRAILDTGAEVVELTAEHRIGASPAELARLEAAGGRLARLNEYGAGPSCGVDDGVGPVRLWPGGIMVGRAIGDRDVGSILLPNPHIRQVRPPAGWLAGWPVELPTILPVCLAGWPSGWLAGSMAARLPPAACEK